MKIEHRINQNWNFQMDDQQFQADQRRIAHEDQHSFSTPKLRSKTPLPTSTGEAPNLEAGFWYQLWSNSWTSYQSI